MSSSIMTADTAQVYRAAHKLHTGELRLFSEWTVKTSSDLALHVLVIHSFIQFKGRFGPTMTI